MKRAERLIKRKVPRTKGIKSYTRHIKRKLGTRGKKTLALFLILLFFIISILYLLTLSYNSQIEDYITRGEFSKSLVLINDRLRDDKNDIFALKQKGRVYSLLALRKDIAANDYEAVTLARKAISILTSLLDKNYKTSDVYFLMGLNAFIIGEEEYETSLQFLEEAILINKKDELIDAYISKNKKLLLTVNNTKYFFTIFGLCGYLNFQLGKYKESIRYFKKALVKEQNTLVYNFYMGLGYFNVRDFERAKDKLKSVILRKGKDSITAYAYFVLSNIALMSKEYGISKKYINKAIDIVPSADNYYQIGLIYEATNNIKTAFAFWTKALEIDPKNNKARQRIIRFEKKLKTN